MTHWQNGNKFFLIIVGLVTKIFLSLIITGATQIWPRIFLHSSRRTYHDGRQCDAWHKMGMSHQFWQLWLEDHVGEKTLSLNLLLKLGFTKKTFLVSFPSRLLKSAWIESTFPYALLPHHKKAKENTIKITRRISVKLPHIGVLCQLIQWNMKHHLYIMPSSSRDVVV